MNQSTDMFWFIGLEQKNGTLAVTKEFCEADKTITALKTLAAGHLLKSALLFWEMNHMVLLQLYKNPVLKPYKFPCMGLKNP